MYCYNSIQEVVSELIHEIEKREQFIATVEHLLYKDDEMSPESLYKLAKYLRYEFNNVEIFDYLLEGSAKAGYPPAIGDQASKILHQANTRGEIAAVMRLARKAAKAGHLESYGLIGYLYSAGRGVKQNTKKANRYTALAGKNNPYQGFDS